MTKQAEIEVWVLVDENGNAAASACSQESCLERYDEEIGLDRDYTGLRWIKVRLTVPLPAQVELTGTVSEEARCELLVAR